MVCKHCDEVIGPEAETADCSVRFCSASCEEDAEFESKLSPGERDVIASRPWDDLK